MKTIGFVDYYISEWHANNYPAWIKKVNEKIGEDFVVKYAWAEKDVSPLDGKTTAQWCAEFGVEQCQTIEELCTKADYVIVLAPSDPDTHLRLCQEVFKYKKLTYVDKTFAPDYATAKKIFDVAEEYGTKFFTSSALRYATEVKELAGKIKRSTVLGEGSSIDEYIIHNVEMIVSMQGAGATAVKLNKSFNNYMIQIDYADDREGTILFGDGLVYRYVCNDGNKYYVKNIESEFFLGLIEAILNFFKTGEQPFDPQETLEVMKIREKLIEAKDKEGEWLAL